MNLKIGDFGLAIRLTQETPTRHSFCGTPNYMAPEVVANKELIAKNVMQFSEYGFPADVWAIGVFAYNFLVGKSPFPFGNTQQNYSRILEGEFRFPDDSARVAEGRPPISQDAKSLIRYILNIDQKRRPTLRSILQHKFFVAPDDGVPISVIPTQLPRTILNHPLPEDYVNRLRLKGARVSHQMQMCQRLEALTDRHVGGDQFSTSSVKQEPPSLQLDHSLACYKSSSEA